MGDEVHGGEAARASARSRRGRAGGRPKERWSGLWLGLRETWGGREGALADSAGSGGQPGGGGRG
eukprot:6427699-Heterocapsa_arctica.AAC.1